MNEILTITEKVIKCQAKDWQLSLNIANNGVYFRHYNHATNTLKVGSTVIKVEPTVTATKTIDAMQFKGNEKEYEKRLTEINAYLDSLLEVSAETEKVV